jgi:hypothetical protein
MGLTRRPCGSTARDWRTAAGGYTGGNPMQHHAPVSPRLLVLGGVAAALLALGSCGEPARGVTATTGGSSGATPATATPPPELLLEDFEDLRRWSIDSAANYAELSSSADHTQGLGALAVAYADNGRGKTLLRAEVDDDFSAVEAVRLDVFNATPGHPTCALVFRTANGSLYETRPRALEPGWNRDLAFRFAAVDWVDKTDLAKWVAERDHVNRLIIAVAPDGGKAGTVVIDNLRVAAPGAVRRGRPPAVLAVRRPEAAVAPGHSAEIQVDLAYPLAPINAKDKSALPYFDRMTAVGARCVAPDGAVREVRGFCTGIRPASGGAVYSYAIRLGLDRPGEWRYQVLVPGAAGMASAGDTGSLLCAAAVAPAAGAAPTAGAAMVGVDRGDRRFFSDAEGAWFYPLGENVAWSGDYEPYIAAIAKAGGNWLRTWICPWNNPLDMPGAGPARDVDFASARAIDRLFALAEEHGVRVQLVLHYHGMLGGDWANSPWNQAHGGPCADPREFFTNGAARQQFRRYLDYVVARWGHSTSLFAWELFNEVDLCPRFADRDVVDWHREMSGYLAAIDPYRHPVTTSVAWYGALPQLWRLPDLAFIQSHSYGETVAAAFDQAEKAFRDEPKPMFLGEFGRGTEPRDDQVDPQGRMWHQALWQGWLRGFAGAPMPWWWDTHIEPNHLLSHLRGFAGFVAGEDRRGWHATRVGTVTASGLVVEALIGADRGYAYCHDPALTANPGQQPLAALWPQGAALELTGLPPGTWSIEYWDASAGTVVATETADCTAQGVLALAPPAKLGGDFALKLRRAAPAPAIRVR